MPSKASVEVTYRALAIVARDTILFNKMIRSFVSSVSTFISDLLQKPLRVLSLCLFLLFIGLFLDGSLIRLWSLHRDSGDLVKKIEALEAKSLETKMKIRNAKDPQFIEIQARDRFDLAGEGDLIFVFSDEE